MNKLLFLTLSLLLITSCKPNNSNKNPEPARPQFQGDLEKKAHEIYAQSNESDFYDCDFQQKSQVLELTAAVEANRANIIELAKQDFSTNSEAKIITMNGYQFLDYGPKKEQVNQWEEDRYSWKSVYNLYLKVKNNPKHKAWIIINSAARSLILEDETRIISASHPGIRRADKDKILRALTAIENCAKEELCIKPQLQADEEAWLREGSYHNWILSRINSEDSFEKKRKRIQFLQGDISAGARRFGFSKNSDIKSENDTLIVPLDLSILGAESEPFIQRLQNTWGVEGLNLKVINSTSGFKVQIADTPGERAYVSYYRRIMQLYSPPSLTTVDHEFGHILGLMDTYYTSFDPQTCDYVDEFNRADIMSMKGRVLPEHIQSIKAAYGL